MKLKKRVEKSVDEEMVVYSECGRFKMTTTLSDLVESIKERYQADEIAYFMYLLTDDGGELETEQEYLKIMAQYSSDLANDDEDWKDIAADYKKLVKDYQK